MTIKEAQSERQVHARMLVYKALGEVKRLLSDLDIVPNMWDYLDPEQFRTPARCNLPWSAPRRVVGDFGDDHDDSNTIQPNLVLPQSHVVGHDRSRGFCP